MKKTPKKLIYCKSNGMEYPSSPPAKKCDFCREYFTIGEKKKCKALKNYWDNFGKAKKEAIKNFKKYEKSDKNFVIFEASLPEMEMITENHQNPDKPCSHCGGDLRRVPIEIEKIMIDGFFCLKCRKLGLKCAGKDRCGCDGEDALNK